MGAHGNHLSYSMSGFPDGVVEHTSSRNLFLGDVNSGKSDSITGMYYFMHALDTQAFTHGLYSQYSYHGYCSYVAPLGKSAVISRLLYEQRSQFSSLQFQPTISVQPWCFMLISSCKSRQTDVKENPCMYFSHTLDTVKYLHLLKSIFAASGSFLF